MIDRRDLLSRAALVLGGAVSSGTALGVLSGCVAAPKEAGTVPAAGKFFSSEEAAMIEAISEHILPRTDTPGAIDVGVPAFIDRMLADFHGDEERASVRAGLARANADASAEHGRNFASLSSSQQVALLQVYDREAFAQRQAGSDDTHFFHRLKELTTVGFFTSETGASKVLKYDPIPGKLRADIPYSEIGRAWST